MAGLEHKNTTTKDTGNEVHQPGEKGATKPLVSTQEQLDIQKTMAKDSKQDHAMAKLGFPTVDIHHPYKEDFQNTQKIGKQVLDELNKPLVLKPEDLKKVFEKEPPLPLDPKLLEQIKDKLNQTGLKPETWEPNPFKPHVTTKDGHTEIDHGWGKGKEEVDYGPDGKPNHVHRHDGQDWTKNKDGTWNVTVPGKPPDFAEHTYKNQKISDVEVNPTTGELSWSVPEGRRHIKPDGSYEDEKTLKPHEKEEQKQTADAQKGDSTEQKVKGQPDSGDTQSQERGLVKKDKDGNTEIDYPGGKKAHIHNDKHGNPDHIEGPDGATYNRNAEGNWQKITYNPTYQSEILHDGTVSVGADGSIDISYKDIAGNDHHQGYDANGKAFKDPGVGNVAEKPGIDSQMVTNEAKAIANVVDMKDPQALQKALDTLNKEYSSKDIQKVYEAMSEPQKSQLEMQKHVQADGSIKEELGTKIELRGPIPEAQERSWLNPTEAEKNAKHVTDEISNLYSPDVATHNAALDRIHKYLKTLSPEQYQKMCEQLHDPFAVKDGKITLRSGGATEQLYP